MTEPYLCIHCGEFVPENAPCPNGCEKDDAELIQFPGSNDRPEFANMEGPIQVRRPDYRGCQHRTGVEIDESLRTVFCKQCGVQLDPIEVILGWRWIWIQIQHKRAALKRETEKWERQRENARKRRAKGRTT